MSLISGTWTKYGGSPTVGTTAPKGIREDLSDIIYDISPMDTPFVSGAGRGPAAKQVLFEWQTDALATVNTANKAVEGDEASFSTPAPTTRVGNYTQISTKTLILSGTLEAVDAAGRKSELAYQIAKRGKEMKRDIEAICFENLAGDAGSVSTARQTATLGAWVYSNDDFGTGGGLDAYTGVPNAARTDGTQRAFTETILKAVCQLVWTSGGELKNLFVGPVNKQKVSNFIGVVTRNFDISNASPRPTAVIAAIDVYVSDFGTLRVMPSRFQRERDAWFIDFDYVSLSYLRPFKIEKLAKTGDAEKRMLLAEWGLRVNNEAALGIAADLTTS